MKTCYTSTSFIKSIVGLSNIVRKAAGYHIIKLKTDYKQGETTVLFTLMFKARIWKYLFRVVGYLVLAGGGSKQNLSFTYRYKHL